MELNCYGFELQHLGILIFAVAFRDCADCLPSLYMHGGAVLAFTWAWLPQNGESWWLIRRRAEYRLGLLLNSM